MLIHQKGRIHEVIQIVINARPLRSNYLADWLIDPYVRIYYSSDSPTSFIVPTSVERPPESLATYFVKFDVPARPSGTIADVALITYLYPGTEYETEIDVSEPITFLYE